MTFRPGMRCISRDPTDKQGYTELCSVPRSRWSLIKVRVDDVTHSGDVVWSADEVSRRVQLADGTKLQGTVRITFPPAEGAP